MKGEAAAFFSSVHRCHKDPGSAHSSNLTDCGTPAWIFPSPLRTENGSHPARESMYPSESDPSLESQPLESQPLESQPLESQPLESQPLDSQPLESQPLESQPLDSQPLESQPLESQLEFFHKLGYSTAQVQAVQQKFGPSIDTDKVLGELVRIGASRGGRQGPVTTMSVLVPRGDFQTAGPTLQMPVSGSSPQSTEESIEDGDALRPIVIDGSNVAMSHGNKEVFSCLGIQLAVNFFLDRGHTEVTVFVPSWRKEQPRPDVPITDQHILRELERRKILVFTPSRRVAGKRVVCNDDCFIVKLGYESDGVVVSNDMYRDLQGEKPEWKRFIEERLLMYSFVNNKFMPPDDPLGRHGPTLDNFLRRFPKTPKKQPCPYGKKCTYGIKCKFLHPERVKQPNRSFGDERGSTKLTSTSQKQPSSRSSPVPGQSLSQVEDMAKKLTLKDHRNENVVPTKVNPRSSKRAASRKEKTSHHSLSDHGSVANAGSQEQLDSGLGSIDSQPFEAWSVGDQQYKPSYFQQKPINQRYCGPRSAPCSCCSHGPPVPQNQCHSNGPVSSRSADMGQYGPRHYPSYGKHPLSMPAYGQPADFQNRYWSGHSGAAPPAVDGPPLERSQGAPRQPRPGSKERDVVRKKLLAIFSAQLVDTAMNMFPQMLDPQMLVAEILMLQSQNRSLR